MSTPIPPMMRMLAPQWVNKQVQYFQQLTSRSPTQERFLQLLYALQRARGHQAH